MDTANTEVYTYRQTLSLHDALPILVRTEEGQKPSVFQGLYRQIGMFGEGASGAGEGNRTLVVSLGSCCSTIELHPRTCSWPVPAPSGASLCRKPRCRSIGQSRATNLMRATARIAGLTPFPYHGPRGTGRVSA